MVKTKIRINPSITIKWCSTYKERLNALNSVEWFIKQYDANHWMKNCAYTYDGTNYLCYVTKGGNIVVRKLNKGNKI